MPPAHFPLSAIILAGGQSRRMGHDKSLMRVPDTGQTLIEQTIASARTVADDIVISTNDAARYAWLPYPTVADVPGAKGPLGGIAAGLGAIAGQYGLVLACDLPLLAPAVLRVLVEQLRPEDDAVVPRHADGECEPLCAIYHVSTLPTLLSHIQGQQFAVHQVLEAVATHWVDDAMLRAVDPQLQSFSNVNTPDEWRVAWENVAHEAG
ncbi:MAG: molybdenum cofactor guanylyltransferase [Ktedonobacterales bacterium]|nr:molybdenum cofactor guanylyltransferase [Ktedonobacterales bacterium]